MEEQPPRSWGDMIKEIELSKRTLPWERPGAKIDVTPVVRVRQRDVKLKEREVDPVLMKFRDPEQEKAHQMRRDLISQHLRRTPHQMDSMHSILAHTSTIPNIVRKEDRNGSKYHILSKLPLEEHHEVPTLYNDEAMIIKLKSLQNKVRSKPRSHRRYSILTNMFLEDHEGTSAKEREQLQRRLEEVYWRNHKYDLIRCRDYDPAQEEQYQQTQKVVEDRKREKKASRLPKRWGHTPLMYLVLLVLV